MGSVEAMHLQPTAELAERVLLPGDPHRALAIAQSLLEAPLMFNHQRGLWGYTGKAPDGWPLTVQATGVGGPSAAVVVEELVELGARVLVRVGTCGALVPDLALGDLIVATDALSADGASAALEAGDEVPGDARIAAALIDAGAGRARRATVASTDLFYDNRPDVAGAWLASGAIAVEMEAATIFRIAERREVRAGCVLAVTDLLAEGDARRRTRMDRAGVETAGLAAGEVAVAALMREAEAGEGEADAPAGGRPAAEPRKRA